MKIFYQKESVKTLMKPGGTIQLFGHNRQTQAVKNSSLSSSIRLLATTHMLSPMATLDAKTVHPLTHNAYGFMSLPEGQPVGFNGKRIDMSSCMYALGQGYRWYSTVLMRFASPDEISPFGAGGINTYAYVHNDPTNRSDPGGKTARTYTFDGKKYRFYENLTKIYDFGNDHGIFISQPQPGSNKKPRLFIRSHGFSDGIRIENTYMNDLQLSKWLPSKNIHLKDYRSLTLNSCGVGVATGKQAPLAQRIANREQIKVKAPAGIEWTIVDESHDPTKFDIGMQAAPHAGFFPLAEYLYAYESVFQLTTFIPQIRQQQP